MTAQEKYDFTRRVAELSVFEQLEIIEELVRQLRRAHFDHAKFSRELDEMIADPGFQRVLHSDDINWNRSNSLWPEVMDTPTKKDA